MSLNIEDVIKELKEVRNFIVENDFDDVQIVGTTHCHCCGKEKSQTFYDGNFFRRALYVAIEELEYAKKVEKERK